MKFVSPSYDRVSYGIKIGDCKTLTETEMSESNHLMKTLNLNLKKRSVVKKLRNRNSVIKLPSSP